MCREVVAAPLSLQDTVYPILRKKSLHFCEKSKKFLKLCTAVRKKYKMKRLRSRACSDGQRARPLRLLTAFASTSPKGRGLGSPRLIHLLTRVLPFVKSHFQMKFLYLHTLRCN